MNACFGCATPETGGALEDAVKEVSCCVTDKSLTKRCTTVCEGGDTRR